MDTSVLSAAMCRCCASEGSFKDLLNTYRWMGEEEVYHKMLQECFNISLEKVEGENGGICEVCITQLRNAANFKKQVQHTEKQFRQLMSDKLNKSGEVKVELTADEDSQSDNDMAAEFLDPDYEVEVPVKAEQSDASDDDEPIAKTLAKKRSAAAAKASTSRAKKPKTEPDTSKRKGRQKKKQEILEKKRISEKKRIERIKNDPEKYEALREKRKLKYLKQKEKGKRKLVSDMTERERRQMKEKWRHHSKKYRLSKKIAGKLAAAIESFNTRSNLESHDRSCSDTASNFSVETPKRSKKKLNLESKDPSFSDTASHFVETPNRSKEKLNLEANDPSCSDAASNFSVETPNRSKEKLNLESHDHLCSDTASNFSVDTPKRSKKKLSKQEVLERKRIYERRRIERIKNDPEKYAALKEKHKLTYLQQKEKGKRKLVSDMTEKERTQMKEKWRRHSATYRYLQKIAEKLDDHSCSDIASNFSVEMPKSSKKKFSESQDLFSSDITSNCFTENTPKKSKNKLSKQEVLERKRINDRRRIERIKNDPEKYAALKEKHKLKYLEQKEKGKRKLVSDMTEKERTQMKEKWRRHSATYRYSQKIAEKLVAIDFGDNSSVNLESQDLNCDPLDLFPRHNVKEEWT